MKANLKEAIKFYEKAIKEDDKLIDAYKELIGILDEKIKNAEGDELEKLKKQSRVKGMVLDGWTRIIFEAVLTDEALNWYEWGKDMKVILIKISSKASYNRLTKRRQCKKCGRLIPWIGEFKKIKNCDKCGGDLITRVDDNIKSIKKRLEEYKDQTTKAINYYKKQGRIIEINGEQSIEDVFKEILGKIKKN